MHYVHVYLIGFWCAGKKGDAMIEDTPEATAEPVAEGASA